MKEEIITRLNNVESEECVKILYACESGSRAWGFPSTNSDFAKRRKMRSNRWAAKINNYYDNSKISTW